MNKQPFKFEVFSIFDPSKFQDLRRKYQTTEVIQKKISPFCSTYGLDAYRCADELFSFSSTFEKLRKPSIEKSDDEAFGDEIDSEPEVESEVHDKTKRGKNNFMNALQILCDPKYSLEDAYPHLCQVYATVAAIPVTSATAERSFSALKRVKARLRSTMIQERLEALLLMAIERKIIKSIEVDKIIDAFATSSAELTKALII